MRIEVIAGHRIFQESDAAQTAISGWPVALVQINLDQASGFQNRGYGIACEAPVF
jgi:hypothetical protein